MVPLTIRGHYPTKVVFSTTENAHEGPVHVEAQIGVGVGSNTSNNLDWRVSTKVTFTANAGKVEIAKGEIEFVGFFDVPSEIKEPDRLKFVAAHGSSILYAATRELVANISARRPNGTITLPIGSFQNIGADIAKQPKSEVVSATI